MAMPEPVDSREIEEILAQHIGLRPDARRPVTALDLERTAFVCAGSPDAAARRGGPVAGAVRKAVFKLTRWYVEPFVVQQRAFNLTLIRHIADLERRIVELEAERGADRE